MAFRLETFQFDCRVNMPTRYGRDVRCRGCNPGLKEQDQEKEQENEQEQEAQEQEEQEQVEESQEHLESCPGFSELWQGLGPYSLLTRCRFFQRVKTKRLKQKQQMTADDSRCSSKSGPSEGCSATLLHDAVEAGQGIDKISRTEIYI